MSLAAGTRLGPYEVSQQVTLPATATGISLQFQLHISTAEEVLQAFDKLRVRVRDTNGQLLTTLKVYSNQQAEPSYARLP